MQHTITIDYRQPKNRHSGSSLVTAFFHLEHLLKAGVDIGEALDELADNDKGSGNVSWLQIARSVKQGQSLSVAMGALPNVFNPQVIALARAGESSGELAAACASCMKLLQWQISIKSRLITVLVYPVFALTLLVCVVVFLMVYMVPAIGGFLLDSSAGLSWHARMLFTLSEWLLQYAYLLPIAVLSTYLPVTVGRSCSLAFRVVSDSYLLKMPVVGKLIADLELSRYCNSCAHLYGSGVALSGSMEIAEGVLTNHALRQSLHNGRALLMSGVPLAAALNAVPLLPVVFKRIIAAGESTGVLEQALLQASHYQQQQCDQTLERTEKLIAPVMLLVIGVVLLWIVVSLLGPVYESAINTVLWS